MMRQETTSESFRAQVTAFESMFLLAFTVCAGTLAVVTVPSEKWVQVWNLAKFAVGPSGFAICAMWITRCVRILITNSYTTVATLFGWVIVCAIAFAGAGFLFLLTTIKL